MNPPINMSNENKTKDFLNTNRQTLHIASWLPYSQRTTFITFYTFKQTFKVAKIEKIL